MSGASRSTTAFPFLPLLTLLFVAAKVFGFINWPWLLVFAPILAPLALAAALAVIAGLCFVLAKAIATQVGGKGKPDSPRTVVPFRK